MSKIKLTDETKNKILELSAQGLTSRQIGKQLGIGKSTINDFLKKDTHKSWWEDFFASTNDVKPKGPKILTLDIETAPILAHVWRTFKQNVGLNMIEQDWYILSFAAKWYDSDEVIYMDKRDTFNDEDDLQLLKVLAKLMDEADIIITQNGKGFDEKKINARVILNGMKPISPYRHIDTLEIAKKHFGFTSNKLEYMTDKLCKVYKKLKHGKFPGFDLWKECLAGNMEAWNEMEEYNIHDVLSLEELYVIMRPFFKNHPNLALYYDDNTVRCNKCGSEDTLEHAGYAYTNLSKFDKFECTSCGGYTRGRVNLLSEEKRKSLQMNIT
jgi:transposase-like protein